MKRLEQFVLFLVSLKTVVACPHGEIRLVNVTAEYQGTVEVCVAGRWSGVCADRQSHRQEAYVVCRQLGCGYGIELAHQQDSCSEQRYKFHCLGHESNLTSCSILDSSNCSSSNGAGCVRVWCLFCPGPSLAPQGLLPYGNSSGDNQLPNSLDVSSGPLNLTQSFPYFGSMETTIFVNSHGVLSFRSEFLQYNQQPLPYSSTWPLILLFWSDTNIGLGGDVYYREANDTETLALGCSLLFRYCNNSFYPTSLFIATWSQVRRNAPFFYTEINSYQAILMTNEDTSYICLLYEEVQWGSGAQIGFNAGDGNRSLTVPGGFTSQTLNIINLSNVGRPGVFIYQVNGDTITSLGEGGIERPTQLRVSQVSSTSLHLSWTNTSTAVEKFNTYCYYWTCPYCSHLPVLDVIQTTQTSAVVSGLVPYTEYGCCVSALAGLRSESDCSEEITLMTLAVVPSVPLNVTLTNTTSISVQLEWSSPQYSNGTFTHYTVRCSQREHIVIITVSNSSRAEKVTGLQPFSKYICCVSASNEVGMGTQACVNATTQSAPPTEPVDVITSTTDTSSIVLVWREPEDTYGQDVLFYNISCTSLNRTVTTEEVFDTFIKVTGLSASTNYNCCIAAVNTVGEGESVCVLVLTTEADKQESLGLVAGISGGALLAVLVLLVVVISTIVICRFKKRKQVNKKREPTTDKPELNNTVPDNAYSVCYKPDNKEEVEIRYERPVLKSTAGAKTEKKEKEECGNKTLPPQAQSIADQHTQHGQLQEDEKIYQPLIPPKTYITPAVSAEYQDLVFDSSKESRSQDELTDAAGNSEGQYEVVGRPEETNQYEPVTFGVSKSPHTDGVYQTLSKRDESSHYQDLHSVRT